MADYNNNKNNNTATITGVVLVVALVIGIVAWAYRDNDLSNIEPAAGNSQMDYNSNNSNNTNR